MVTEDTYQEEVRAFQRDVASIQQDIKNKRQSLDRALQEAKDKIRSLATTIIAEYTYKFKIDWVVKEELLLVFRNQLNITDDILQILNERTKDAQLEISEQTTATGE